MIRSIKESLSAKNICFHLSKIYSCQPSFLRKRKVLGNRIITTLAEGMTAQDATSSEIGATPCAIAFYCLNRID